MGKKKDYQLNGQLCFDFNTNTEHYVVQSNELLEGKQNLKLNSAKIVRALIMQIKVLFHFGTGACKNVTYQCS